MSQNLKNLGPYKFFQIRINKNTFRSKGVFVKN